MKTHYTFLPALALLGLLFMASCGKKGNDNAAIPEELKDFNLTKTGLYYKIFNHNTDTSKAFRFGRAIDFHLVVKNYKDSMVTNTYDKKPIENYIYQPPRFKGDLAELMNLFAEGDSVIIVVSSDSLAKVERRRPPFFPEGSFVKYHFKILKVKSADEARKNIAQLRKESEEKIIRDDSVNVQNYLKEKGLLEKAKSTPSGMYYVITKEGTGSKPAKYDTVYTNYVGRLTNGKLFDTNVLEVAKKEGQYKEGSDSKYQAFTFPLGTGRVIRAWDEGLGLLNKGSKATLVVPSRLAYGPRGSGKAIPPNAVLIFDVELTDFKKGVTPDTTKLPQGHSTGDIHGH